jgi:amidophosphoribosyltransferase
VWLVCGVLGLLLHDATVNAASEICEGLSLLQHRGQDACGIVTCGAKGRLYQCKANGMVRDVFDSSSIANLIGGMGVGHGLSFAMLLFYHADSQHHTIHSTLSDRWQLSSR